MLFFLDTASIEQIKIWKEKGLVDGITTNPTLLSKEGLEPVDQLKAICKIVKGPVSAQVTETKAEKMIKQASQLKKISKNIIIKLPSTVEGLLAAKVLTKKKIKTNITLGFDPSQIIAFARLNVTYFSLIVGKTEDWGFSNVISVSETKKIINNLNSKTKLLVASIRNTTHLKESVINGADVLTVPPSTWAEVYKNKYTLIGENDFQKNWISLPKGLRKKYEII
jgi:transaldolase